jgi:hypothetical protein
MITEVTEKSPKNFSFSGNYIPWVATNRQKEKKKNTANKDTAIHSLTEGGAAAVG